MNKQKAAKQREHQRKLKLQEEQKMESRLSGIKSMTSGFARTPRTETAVEAFNASKIPVYPKARTVSSRSLDERFPTQVAKQKPQLSEEMQKREALAQERYREIQKRVDIGYNKGGLMLLSEGEVEAMKRGELRRRS